MDLKSQIKEVLEDAIKFEGIDLVDLEFSGSDKRKKLVLFIDKVGGISVDDCELVSKKAGLILEVNEVIPFSYVLEVSSPGLDRPLVTVRDFERNVDRLVEFHLAEPVEKSRTISGTIQKVSENVVEVEKSGETVSLSIENITKAKRIIQF